MKMSEFEMTKSLKDGLIYGEIFQLSEPDIFYNKMFNGTVQYVKNICCQYEIWCDYEAGKDLKNNLLKYDNNRVIINTHTIYEKAKELSDLFQTLRKISNQFKEKFKDVEDIWCYDVEYKDFILSGFEIKFKFFDGRTFFVECVITDDLKKYMDIFSLTFKVPSEIYEFFKFSLKEYKKNKKIFNDYYINCFAVPEYFGDLK